LFLLQNEFPCSFYNGFNAFGQIQDYMLKYKLKYSKNFIS
jgi:hypothetical protein